MTIVNKERLGLGRGVAFLSDLLVITLYRTYSEELMTGNSILIVNS